MIHRYSFRNFYSFRDEQVVDFTVPGNAPHTDAYVDSAFKERGKPIRVGKVLVAFGHNASGKTNLLKPLGFLRWFIVNSFALEQGAPLPFEPFLFGSSEDEESHVRVEFEIDGRMFTYDVEMTKQGILKEGLEWRQSTPSARSRKLMARQWDPDRGSYRLEMGPEGKLPNDYRAPCSRRNCSLLALASQVSNPLAEAIQNYWRTTHCNINMLGRARVDPVDLMREAESFYNSDRFPRALRLLRRWDLGLSDIRLMEAKAHEDEEKSRSVPVVLHEKDGLEFALHLSCESSGTQALIAHLKDVLPVIDAGGAVILDEVDSDLHPRMLESLVGLFLSPVENPKRAQLIMSCHSTPLLHDLDKYQILLVEKDGTLSSEAWRLDDVRKVRRDDNYYAKYMAGAYGAVPDV